MFPIIYLYKSIKLLLSFQNNLECGIYQASEDFSTDMRLIYSNCYTYSIPDSEVYKMAQKLEEYFEQEFSKLKSTVTRGDIDQREVTNADYSTNVEFQLQNVTLEVNDETQWCNCNFEYNKPYLRAHVFILYLDLFTTHA